MNKDYFNSIEELPIWNWWKVSETGNFIYLKKLDYYDSEDYSLEGYELWLKLQNEYIEEFGIDENFQKILRLKKKWIEKRTKYVTEGDRFALMESEIVELDLQEYEQIGQKMDKDSTIITLEEKLGRNIDERRLSVKKYYKYIKHYSKNG